MSYPPPQPSAVLAGEYCDGGTLGELVRSGYGLLHARIVEAMAHVVYERGYAGVSVSAVSARAKISRRSFWEVFETLEDCFLAVLDHGAARVYTLISGAVEHEAVWTDGVRAALAELLAYLDREPAFAHVLLVEAGSPGARARARRERHVATLTALFERWERPADARRNRLVRSGVVAAVLGLLHGELVRGRREPLVALLGELMGVASAPYLDRPSVAREVARAEALARELLTLRVSGDFGRVEVPELLRNSRAHRARACLVYLAERPAASNREIGDAIGIVSHAQISKLLKRMANAGLLEKRAGSPGRPNAWLVTDHGLRVSCALTMGKFEEHGVVTSIGWL